MKKIAAFYDIDGTLYRDSLLTEVFKKLISYEFIEPEHWYNEVKPAFIKYDNRQGEYDDYLYKITDIFKEHLIGLSSQHITHIADKIIKQKGDRVYRFTRDEIQRHHDEGHLVFAISGSPLELVSRMADKYHFDDYRATIYSTDANGNYNGEVIPMWDHVSKSKAIKELCDKYDIDLENSFAYGDTTGDFMMFKLVGNPYAMNPSKELLKKIYDDEDLLKKIHIIVERKDVIYNLRKDDIIL